VTLAHQFAVGEELIAKLYVNSKAITWYSDCPVIVPTGDANVAKYEVVVCYGQPQSIQDVVLNDRLILCAVDLNGQNYSVSDKNFCWRTISNGSRSGAPNLDTLFDGHGDPYGSYCALEIVVPVALATCGIAHCFRF
jgi:hypothetical protein